MALESIALIPSGYKANKLYCQLPVDGGADLTTSRASGATRVNKNGLIEDVATGVPRLDYTNGGCPELLLEPQSTNEIPYSEDFTNVAWSKTTSGTGIAPVVTANQALSPDGSVNADRVVFDLSGGVSVSDASIVSDSVTVASGATTTKSVYLKSNNGLNQNLIIYETTDITQYQEILVTTEWQRFELTSTVASTTSGLSFGLRNVAGGLTIDDTADVLVFGAQLEQQSYATSYIRTSVSAVTRIADEVSGNSSLGQVINSSEGVLYFEGSALEDTSSVARRISLYGDASNSLRVEYDTSGRINGVVFSGGANQCVLQYTTNLTNNLKVAFKYKANDFALWVNGVEVATDPSGSTFTSETLIKLSLDSGFNTAPFYGRIKELKVYDTDLTDAELLELTS